MIKQPFVWLALVACCAAPAQGQLLFDFESGTQGFGPSGFGNGTEFVGVSSKGATEGSAQALSFGHLNGNFSWDAQFGVGQEPGNPIYDAISLAAANPVGSTIDFDVTFVINDLQSYVNFANVTFSINSDAGFLQENNVAEIGGGVLDDVTIPVSIPFDTSGLAGTAANSGFYQLTFALNTDSSNFLADTVYVDNIRINAVPEPASALLVAFGLAAAACGRRRHG